MFPWRYRSINKSQLGTHIQSVAIGIISLPMVWLHVYKESGGGVLSGDRRVSDARGYASSIEYFGFDVDLWIPVAFSFAMSAFLVLKSYGIANFATWQLDLMALVILATILLPLWPCYLGTAYVGFGWFLGAVCAILTIREYLTKFRFFPSSLGQEQRTKRLV